jgi:hypothetical protein
VLAFQQASRADVPKSGVLPLGSPSFSLLLLKEKDLTEELVVARCTKMWLRMHGVPRLFPIPIKRQRDMHFGTEPPNSHALWPKPRKSSGSLSNCESLSDGKSVCLLSAASGSNGPICYFRFSMLSTNWGICFSLKDNPNALKTLNSGTVVAQRERLLLGNEGREIQLLSYPNSTSLLSQTRGRSMFTVKPSHFGVHSRGRNVTNDGFASLKSFRIN